MLYTTSSRHLERSVILHDCYCAVLTLRHETRFTLIRLHSPWLEPSCQTEITDLQLTIGVNEEISRFKIAMQNVGRVDVLLKSA